MAISKTVQASRHYDGLVFSRLVFGTMRLTSWGSNCSDEEIAALLERAVELGITTLDTAGELVSVKAAREYRSIVNLLHFYAYVFEIMLGSCAGGLCFFSINYHYYLLDPHVHN